MTTHERPGFLAAISSEFLLARTSTTNWLVDLLLLGSRLYAGVTIASAGLDKLPTPPWMVDQTAQMGFPAPEFFGTAACLTEFVGGALLALGLLTRPAALSLAVVMGFAAFRFHGVAPITGMHIAQGFVWLFVVFLAIGPGRLSLDSLIRAIASHTTDEGTRTLRLAPALVAAGVLALPAVGYGAYRELALDWQPPEAQDQPPAEIASVSLAGTFNGWDLGANELDDQGDGTWRTTVDFPASGPVAFKFAANGSWDLAIGTDPGEGPSAIEFDANTAASGEGSPSGGNIVVVIPAPGSYVFEVDAATFAFSVTPASDG